MAVPKVESQNLKSEGAEESSLKRIPKNEWQPRVASV